MAISHLSKSTGFEFVFKAFYEFCKLQKLQEITCKKKFRLVQIVYTTYDGEFDSDL